MIVQSFSYGWCPCGSLDEAKGMPRRIRENSIAFQVFLGAKFDNPRLGVVKVVDHHVKVELLRPIRVRPSRSLEIAA